MPPITAWTLLYTATHVATKTVISFESQYASSLCLWKFCEIENSYWRNDLALKQGFIFSLHLGTTKYCMNQ